LVQRDEECRQPVIGHRGTIHNWINRGTEPCVIAFILIAAKPVTAGEAVLRAQG